MSTRYIRVADADPSQGGSGSGSGGGGGGEGEGLGGSAASFALVVVLVVGVVLVGLLALGVLGLVAFVRTESGGGLVHRHGPSPGPETTCMSWNDVAVYGDLRTTELRNQWDMETLVDAIARMASCYVRNDTFCYVTIPDMPWTGGHVPPHRNMDTVSVCPACLSPNEFIERLISVAAAVQLESDSFIVMTAYSTDLHEPSIYDHSNGGYLKTVSDVCAALAEASNQDGPLDGASNSHVAALRQCTGFFYTTARLSANERYAYVQSFLDNYDSLPHKHYNMLFTYFAMLFNARFFTTSVAMTAGVPGAAAGLFPEQARAVPKMLEVESMYAREAATWEREAVGAYFWPRLVTKPGQSSVLSDAVDPEGNSRDPALSAGTFFSPFNAGQYEQWAQDFYDANPFALIGFPLFNATLLRDWVDYALDANETDIVMCQSEMVWNTLMKPQLVSINETFHARADEAHDDHYVGAWRAKLERVKLVNRDNNSLAESFVTVFNGVDITVPFDSAGNAALATSQALLVDPVQATGEAILLAFFEESQAGIAEMDQWLGDNLGLHLDMRPNSAFGLLYKINATRGILQGAPYSSVSDIFSNYAAQQKIVDVDAPLSDLVFDSGFAVAELMRDAKEYLLNEYVIENWADFNFASQGSAGLYELNNLAQQITYNDAFAAVNQEVLDAKSDVQVLGRHYGYNADGTVKNDEWVTPSVELLYTWQEFDYIYRQHFAYDKQSPLTPANVFDPINPVPYYQYTDPAHSAQRAQFIDDFNALEILTVQQRIDGRKGTYYLFKTNWVINKLSAYLYANGVAIGALSADFYNTFIDGLFYDSSASITPPIGWPYAWTHTCSGRTSGSAANSALSVQIGPTLVFVSQMRFATLNPLVLGRPDYNLGTWIHETIYGHGLTRVPSFYYSIYGGGTSSSWLGGNVQTNPGPQTLTLYYESSTPGQAVAVEGWATYAEFVMHDFGLYLNFNSSGVPVPGSVNYAASASALANLARIAARQVVAVGENFSKRAWTFYKSVDEFAFISDLPVSVSLDFHLRFIMHPTQQTTYAAGLVNNIATQNLVEAALALQGKCLDTGNWMWFRVIDTQSLFGSTLSDAALENLAFLGKPCPP